jgi:hypothetical protein
MSKQKSRREILRKTAYVVPTVLTLAIKPASASTGSGQYQRPGELERSGGEWEGHGNSQKERESRKPKKDHKKH